MSSSTFYDTEMPEEVACELAKLVDKATTCRDLFLNDQLNEYVVVDVDYGNSVSVRLHTMPEGDNLCEVETDRGKHI